MSDNGPQFSASTFAKFAEEYGFTHITSSPKFPQANGEVERAVQTVKNLLKKAQDPYKALMAYRATPLESGLSPAELLMGRKIRTRLPVLPAHLVPDWPYLDQFREKDGKLKARQKANFDTRHAAKSLPDLHPGDPVWLQDQKTEGTVLHKAGTPRSYIIQTPNGHLRRNRRHLNLLPETPIQSERGPKLVTPSAASTPDHAPSLPLQEKTSTPEHTAEGQTTRSGRVVKLPARFKD